MMEVSDAKRIISSLSLSFLDFVDYLVVTRSQFDITISDEPYVAFMFIYNLKSGKYMARIWNQTVAVGWALKNHELVDACRTHFGQGRPCIGHPKPRNDINSPSEDFLVSQTPIPRIISKSCHKFLGKYRKDCPSCQECQKLSNLETNMITNTWEEAINVEEEHGEDEDLKNEYFEDDWARNSIELYEAGKEILNTEKTKEADNLYEPTLNSTITKFTSGPGDPSTNQQETRPPFTFAQMIVQALIPGYNYLGIPLPKIISFISQKYPFYRMQDESWQKTITQVLNINEGFEKVKSYKDDIAECWRMKDGFEPQILKDTLFCDSQIENIPSQNLKPIKFQNLKPAKVTTQENDHDDQEADGSKNAIERLKSAKDMGKACPWCDKVLHTSTYYRVHRMFAHHFGTFQCPICLFQCHFAKDVADHMKKESHFGCVNCSKCKRDFALDEIECHYVICATGCPTCGKTFSSPKVLISHLKYAHKGEGDHDENETKCCESRGKQFKNSLGLYGHIRRVHEGKDSNKKPKQCGICGETFKCNSTLHYHKTKVHFREENERQCQKCGLKVANPMLLRNHLKSHEAPQFKCSFCSKMFKRRIGLVGHERAHKGEKPFPCSLCSGAFTTKRSLGQHMKGAHKIVGPKGGKAGWMHWKKQEKDLC